MFKGAGCQPAPYGSCPGHCAGLVDHLARGAHSGIDLEARAVLLVDGYQQLWLLQQAERRVEPPRLR